MATGKYAENSSKDIIRNLLKSAEPSVVYKTQTLVLSRKLNSNKLTRLREAIRSSARVQRLLSERGKDGRIPCHPYRKWFGAHWILAALADLGYPAGDRSLIPLREQVLEWLLSKEHEGNVKPHHDPYIAPISVVRNLPRIHASMEGNALHSILTLGLHDQRADELAERLLETQWPDGGWNCDKDSKASHSSFWESLIPLRALALHAKLTGSRKSSDGARRVSEIFLGRRLFKRRRDGRIMREDFTKLHYPCYWHYDILFGLKVMAESGLIQDKRCEDALDLLESKRLSDGGFPAEERYYACTKSASSQRSLVDWGGTSQKHMNEWVTVDALHVLSAAGRMSVDALIT